MSCGNSVIFCYKTWKFNHRLALLALYFNLSMSTPLNPRIALAVFECIEDFDLVLLASASCSS